MWVENKQNSISDLFYQPNRTTIGSALRAAQSFLSRLLGDGNVTACRDKTADVYDMNSTGINGSHNAPRATPAAAAQ